MLKFLHLNLHHSKVASANLVLRLGSDHIDITLIQEPWLTENLICGLRMKNYALAYASEGRPRTCILYKTGINVLFLNNYSNADLTVISIKAGDRYIWVASAYFAHDHELVPEEAVSKLVRDASHTRVGLVMGADANAHHELWGSSDTNERGESLYEFIISTNLVVCNVGREPTFIIKNRQEVLDVTLASFELGQEVRNWRVLREHSFSDHRFLAFELDTHTQLPLPKPRKSPKSTDWAKFRQLVETFYPQGFLTPVPGNRFELESAVTTLTGNLIKAFEDSTPTQSKRGKQRPPWWNDGIRKLRSRSRISFNRAKRTRSHDDWEKYKANLQHYKYCIRRSKNKSWKTFCNSIENSADASRLRKVLAKTPSVISNLMKQDGNWTLNNEEVLELLVNAHFPQSDESSSPHEIGGGKAPMSLADRIVCRSKLEWAINSFDPFKSTGIDGIIPKMLQEAYSSIEEVLMHIFKGCIVEGYIPSSWTKTRVVFIPKAGKASHVSPNDYRPISLSSFLLKTMERLIDLHLKLTIDTTSLSTSQHAYSKGKSTETALHTLVGHIERHISRKEFSLVAFLDIEGAFNNVLPAAITEALIGLHVDNSIVRWIDTLLRNRSILAEVGSSTIFRDVYRGTPQGGVLSPCLWNLVVNSLLRELEDSGCRVIAYADDVAIVHSGMCPQTLSELMQGSLNILQRWASRCGLSINPRKTELILFTRRYKLPSFVAPRIRGETLGLTDRVRYLGLTLDSKLSWKLNVIERARKAQIALYSCRRAIGKKWGFKPAVVNWLYKAVVLPTMMYGVLVWWTALDKTTYIKPLQRVQRAAAICISGALRTTPTIALEVMLNFLPIDLEGRQLAATSAMRLRANNLWRDSGEGHSSIIRKCSLGNLTTDLRPSKPNFEQYAEIRCPSRKMWNEGRAIDGCHHLIFTDGSKLLGKVGSGIFSKSFNLNLAFRLPDHCSVFQAEVYAIKAALDWLRRNRLSRVDICILSDSQAALKALNSVQITSRTVDSCLKSLRKTSEQHNIILSWVPGHRDISGNCRADELARKGTTLPSVEEDTCLDMPFATCKLRLKEATAVVANTRWRTSTIATIARATWPAINTRRAEHLVQLDREELSLVIGALTGHWTIGKHAVRLGISSEATCRSCNMVEATVLHLLCKCPALSKTRRKYLGYYIVDGLHNLASIPVRDLTRFLKSSNVF